MNELRVEIPHGENPLKPMYSIAGNCCAIE